MSKTLHTNYHGVNLHITYDVIRTTAFPKYPSKIYTVVQRVTTDYGVDLTELFKALSDSRSMAMLTLASLCDDHEEQLAKNSQPS